MDVLLTTIIKRPYVFLFLIAFLYLGIRHLGLTKTLIWLVVGYLIAFASEYSSIHNGFPYGEYHYIYENIQGELILAGVPVWDSVSYSFMTYASYSTAIYMMPKTKTWKLWIVGAGLTTLLDVITDPVAKLGKDWFLGEIYYYAHDGWYFNVPFSNFAGWFLVALAIIGANLLIWRRIPDHPPAYTALRAGVRNDSDRRASHSSESWNPTSKVNALYPLFYVSICIFNTIIAFTIEAYVLGTTNLIITGILSGMILFLNKKNS